MDSKGMEEQDVYPAGPFTAWASEDGMKAEVRTDQGRIKERFRGETAWSDAARAAGDRNQAVKRG